MSIFKKIRKLFSRSKKNKDNKGKGETASAPISNALRMEEESEEDISNTVMGRESEELEGTSLDEEISASEEDELDAKDDDEEKLDGIGDEELKLENPAPIDEGGPPSTVPLGNRQEREVPEFTPDPLDKEIYEQEKFLIPSLSTEMYEKITGDRDAEGTMMGLDYMEYYAQLVLPSGEQFLPSDEKLKEKALTQVREGRLAEVKKQVEVCRQLQAEAKKRELTEEEQKTYKDNKAIIMAKLNEPIDVMSTPASRQRLNIYRGMDDDERIGSPAFRSLYTAANPDIDKSMNPLKRVDDDIRFIVHADTPNNDLTDLLRSKIIHHKTAFSSDEVQSLKAKRAKATTEEEKRAFSKAINDKAKRSAVIDIMLKKPQVKKAGIGRETLKALYEDAYKDYKDEQGEAAGPTNLRVKKSAVNRLNRMRQADEAETDEEKRPYNIAGLQQMMKGMMNLGQTGHAWVEFRSKYTDKSDRVRFTVGYMPLIDEAGLFDTVPGALSNPDQYGDSKTGSETRQVTLDKQGYLRTLESVLDYDESQYNLSKENCSTFAARIAKVAGIDMSGASRYIVGKGRVSSPDIMGKFFSDTRDEYQQTHEEDKEEWNDPNIFNYDVEEEKEEEAKRRYKEEKLVNRRAECTEAANNFMKGDPLIKKALELNPDDAADFVKNFKENLALTLEAMDDVKVLKYTRKILDKGLAAIGTLEKNSSAYVFMRELYEKSGSDAIFKTLNEQITGPKPLEESKTEQKTEEQPKEVVPFEAVEPTASAIYAQLTKADGGALAESLVLQCAGYGKDPAVMSPFKTENYVLKCFCALVAQMYEDTPFFQYDISGSLYTDKLTGKDNLKLFIFNCFYNHSAFYGDFSELLLLYIKATGPESVQSVERLFAS